MAATTYLTVLLNGNGLNGPIKRHRVPEWTEKQDPLQMKRYVHKVN